MGLTSIDFHYINLPFWPKLQYNELLWVRFSVQLGHLGKIKSFQGFQVFADGKEEVWPDPRSLFLQDSLIPQEYIYTFSTGHHHSWISRFCLHSFYSRIYWVKILRNACHGEKILRLKVIYCTYIPTYDVPTCQSVCRCG